MTVQGLKRIPFIVFELVIVCYVNHTFLMYSSHLWQYDKELTFWDTTERVIIRPEEMTMAVVVCGNRYNESLTTIKSAVIFATWPLKVVVFADEQLAARFETKLDEWKRIAGDSFTFEVLPIAFPEGENAAVWRGLFKPCASQRLFIPSLLKDVDSVLYVDTDTLFLAPVEGVWRRLRFMDDSQMAALAPEHEAAAGGWYDRSTRHPFYGEHGVNSGVMLMNLTRMRAFNWTEHVVRIYDRYRFVLMFGDQDIINILFSSHPDKVYDFPCRFNYRSDHCASGCRSADARGVAVLHGNRGSFHDGTENPAFRALYTAVKEHRLGQDSRVTLHDTMKHRLANTGASSCGKDARIYTRAMEPYVFRNHLVA